MRRRATVSALFSMLAAWAALAQSDPGASLRAAAERGDAVAVSELIKSGAPLDAKDAAGQTALLLAVAGGRTAVAKALVEAGADINLQARNMDSPWLLAGASGRSEILKLMLPKGPDYALRNRFGGNALIPACERAHVEAVKVLLTSRIDVNHVNNLGWTCLLEIVILGDGGPRHFEVTKLVLAAGANPNIADKDGVSPLTHAKRKGQTEVARLIAEAGGK